MVISTKDKDVLEKGKPSDERRQSSGITRPQPGLADYLAGEAADFESNLTPYLPQELIGGSVPYVAGTEEEAVWNAASQACGTEKVHYTYTIDDDRCWYLACASSSLASNPNSWCPLAAALPKNSEYWDRETVYIYEQEGVASALRWDPDTGRMQVFLGASRTLLPRIQSMDANFVTINAEVADVVPWKNRQLMTEKLSRATARVLVLFGIGINLILMSFLAFQFVLTNTIQGDLADVKQQTQRASEQLMLQAYQALQSDTIKHMVRIQELLTDLQKIDGTLVKYEVDGPGSAAQWEALVPQAFSGSTIGGRTVTIVP
ncbi:MAG: hypothetical protein AAF569_03350, partial [Pseudomonadota bacterium]